MTEVEKIARRILAQRMHEFRYDLVEPNAVRRALGASVAGHLLPDVLARRDQVLADEVVRVREVLRHLVEVTGMARLVLELKA